MHYVCQNVWNTFDWSNRGSQKQLFHSDLKGLLVSSAALLAQPPHALSPTLLPKPPKMAAAPSTLPGRPPSSRAQHIPRLPQAPAPSSPPAEGLRASREGYNACVPHMLSITNPKRSAVTRLLITLFRTPPVKPLGFNSGNFSQSSSTAYSSKGLPFLADWKRGFSHILGLTERKNNRIRNFTIKVSGVIITTYFGVLAGRHFHWWSQGRGFIKCSFLFTGEKGSDIYFSKASGFKFNTLGPFLPTPVKLVSQLGPRADSCSNHVEYFKSYLELPKRPPLVAKLFSAASTNRISRSTAAVKQFFPHQYISSAFQRGSHLRCSYQMWAAPLHVNYVMQLSLF